jgi:hypothetical protein
LDKGAIGRKKGLSCLMHVKNFYAYLGLARKKRKRTVVICMIGYKNSLR